MLSEHTVLQTTVSFHGEVHSAAYFVEGEAIVANIDGKTMRLRRYKVPASATVRAVLLGALANKERQAHGARLNKEFLGTEKRTKHSWRMTRAI
jgi:hypothetical protein